MSQRPENQRAHPAKDAAGGALATEVDVVQPVLPTVMTPTPGRGGTNLPPTPETGEGLPYAL